MRVAVLIGIFFLLLSISMTVRVDASSTSAGNITGMTLSTDPTNGTSVATFSLDGGVYNAAVSVTAYADDVIRVHYSLTNGSPNVFLGKSEPMIAAPLGTWPTMGSAPVDQGTNYLLQTAVLNVIIYKAPFHVDFVDRIGGYPILQDDPAAAMQYDPNYFQSSDSSWLNNEPYSLPSGISKLKCTKVMPANQAYFGLGEWSGPGNRRGANIMCWNRQSYTWGENSHQNPMYMNMPFFYGVQPANGNIPAFSYGIFLDNSCLTTFRLGTQSSTRYSFEAADGQMDYYFFGGGTNHTMKTVIDRYSQLTGRPSMLPKWALGHQLARFSYLDQDWVVNHVVSTAVASNIPLDAVYLDIDYMNVNANNNPTAANSLHQLTMNSDFPNPQQMISSAQSMGVQIVPLIEPWLETLDPYYNTENSNLDFIKDNNGNTYSASIYAGPVSWFDYSSLYTTNRWIADMTNWFHNVQFGGIWNDLTEPEDNNQIPLNALLYDDGQFGVATGSNADSRREWSTERNYFGLRSAYTSYGALKLAYPNKRPFVLTRSGTTGVQRYAIGWSGDTTTDWGRLPACIQLGMNTMISGQGRFGHDLGGFTSAVSGELLERWYEAGSVMPFYRSHCQKSADNVWSGATDAFGWNYDVGREPWHFTAAATGLDYCSLMRNNIQFRYKLMPYLYTLMRNATVNGIPMNTPTYFNYYTDNNTLGTGASGSSLNECDFLVGDFMLAAPVTNQNASTRSVYLPWPDNWYYWPNNTKYSGGQTVTVNAPLGTLPLFVRGGSIIPMGPTMQYTTQFQPSYLDVNCWPEGSSSFTLYEDAGDGWDFTNGVYAMTTYTSSRGSNVWDFSIGARQGSYNPYSAGNRANNIYVYNPQSVQDVLLNGSPLTQAATNNFNAPLPCWFMTSDGKLAVRIIETGSNQTVHVDWSGGVTTGGTNTDPYVSMTVAGTFSNPAWNQTANNMLYLGSNTWQFTTNLVNQTGVQFKFVPNSSWTPTNWGGTTASHTVPFSAVCLLNSTTNILVGGTLSGTYQFTFNDQTLAYSVSNLLAAPTLAVGPSVLTESISVGQNATNQSFAVSNTGTGSVNVVISTNQSWVSVSPLSGSVSNTTETIVVSYSTALLTAGTYNAAITVTATNALNSPQLVNVSITVNPTNGFTSPFANLTVAGTFGNPNWNQLATNMALIASDTWQGSLNIGNGSNFQFKFVANNNWTPTNWGGTTTAQAFPMSGTAVLNSSTNILGSGGYNGLYQFTFHDDTRSYSVVPLLASPYAAIYVPGTYNGWSPSNNVMNLIANDFWQTTLSLTNVTNLQFKFAANGTWDVNWGQTNGQQTQFSIPLSSVAAPNSPHTNIVINGVLNGSYVVTFNDQTLAFTIASAVGDSVGDGISDLWRATYFANQPPGNSSGTRTNRLSCATCDEDGTGQNNLFKYLAGLDPTNPASIFVITDVKLTNTTDMAISFTSVRDKNYVLESTTDLTSHAWSTVSSNISGSDGISLVIDPGATAFSNLFYRARLLLP